jgi:hypothetical protein
MGRKVRKTTQGRKAHKPVPKAKPSREILSRQRVLGTGELLEAILLPVDIRTVLISVQRVRTTWRYLIDSSIRLQPHLFFAPALNTPSPSDSTALSTSRTPSSHGRFPASSPRPGSLPTDIDKTGAKSATCPRPPPTASSPREPQGSLTARNICP